MALKYYAPGGASSLTRVKNGSVRLANALSKTGKAVKRGYVAAKPRAGQAVKRIATGAREVKRRADAYEAAQQKKLRKTRKRYEKEVKKKNPPKRGNPYADQLASFGRF